MGVRGLPGRFDNLRVRRKRVSLNAGAAKPPPLIFSKKETKEQSQVKLNNKPSRPITFTRYDLRGFAEQVAERSSLVFSHIKQQPYLVLNALDPKLAARLRKAL